MKEKERILVTGAGGFIGSRLVRFLREKGYWVRGVDIKLPEFMPSCAHEFLQLDLRVEGNCLEASRGVSKVYNLAANMGGIGFISRIGAEVMHDNILINTFMLEAARQNNVKTYFFSSSACIYPTNKQKKADNQGLKEYDAYPAEPDSFYGWEKLATEKMCQAYMRDFELDVRIARYHNIYGPCGTYQGGREKAPAALCRKVAEASDPGTITVWGDGKQTRSFCYIDDCLEATHRLMESDFTEPLNIGTDRLVTIDELADMVIRVSRKKITKVHEPDAPQGVRGRNADLTLARKVLSWEPRTDLEEGMKHTYEWIEDRVLQSTCSQRVATKPPE